ncbi:MAG: dTDP-4-dehydrorhamnose reductase [Elusimicrobia bacterium]|nr:dTDP-4-dehydrorhamnose reductase [Elusimicrobiota bacterium]
MTHLVTGASGLVGGTLYRHLKNNSSDNAVGTSYRHPAEGLHSLELLNTDLVTQFFKKFHPDIIFHAAAMGSADQCEKNQSLARSINVETTIHLAQLCRNINTLLVFYSSDYIFNGASGPYSEEDPAAPLNYYGQLKVLAEEAIRQILPDNHLIIRTTVIYGWESQGKNFAMSLINRLSHQEKILVPNDQTGTPTFVEDLAQGTLKLIEKKCRGIYHVAGPGLVSRYQFALEIASVFGLNERLIVPSATNKLGQIARRPLSAGLKTEKLRRDLNWLPQGCRQGLQAMKTMGNPYIIKKDFLHEPAR